MNTIPNLLPGSLMARFLWIAAGVLLAGLVVIGFWVTSRIEEGVKDNAGAVTALYVDALITPLVQELALVNDLSAGHIQQLQQILNRGGLRDQVSAFMLWSPSGRIVFSDNADLVGQSFSISPGLAEALAGRVHANFDDAFHPQSYGEARAPLLEVYSPVRSVVDGQIIAVAEFYTSAEVLGDHLLRVRFQSWLVVGAVSLGMFATLSLVVASGSRTIASQRRALDTQVTELSNLLATNSHLSQRVEQANHRIASLNEDNLRRISADLHDGPVQQLAFAALRLDRGGDARQAEIGRAIDEAITEIRDICGGLALPELDGWSLATIARRLAARQEARTGRPVTVTVETGPAELPPAAKICAYRFIQEALNNGAKHAPGASQRVKVTVTDDALIIAVIDDGPGFDPAETSKGLGLVGLRERIAGLKGRLDIETGPGWGTALTMHLPVVKQGNAF